MTAAWFIATHVRETILREHRRRGDRVNESTLVVEHTPTQTPTGIGWVILASYLCDARCGGCTRRLINVRPEVSALAAAMVDDAALGRLAYEAIDRALLAAIASAAPTTPPIVDRDPGDEDPGCWTEDA